ncbi:MAG TPA: dTDP-4-dehydrorhamnose 3,5-epimerase [Burkholderiaceae bacterium]|nr:dTDP-4-dehydrorhamnose 3,5-epimerase [Burkholderiaceae bacterium]
MNVTRTELPDVLVLEPNVFEDSRGWLFESYNARTFRDATGSDPSFVQDNQSHSRHGVLRGLHYQIRQAQGKLIRVTAGEIFDVAVDLRRSSPTFGRWEGIVLSAANRRMAWIPPGFAHGFLVLSDAADVLYKASDFYAPQHERTLAWDDPALRIGWPLERLRLDAPIVSPKDAAGAPLSSAETFE